LCANQVVEAFAGGLTVFDPQITSRGFMMLDHKIDVDGARKTIGAAVKDISRNRQSYTQVGDFVGSLLGGFAKSLGS
jgi:hypothetical protein